MNSNDFDVPVDYWREVCEDLDHPLACVDLQNRFVWVNAAYERLVGYSIAELLGRTWMEITAQKDVGGDLASVRLVMAGKMAHYTMSKHYVHKRGHLVPIELTVRRFPRSMLSDIVCFAIDAQPAKATRPELDQVQHELTQMIEELQRRLDMSDKLNPGVNVTVGNTHSTSQVEEAEAANTTIYVLGGAIVILSIIIIWLAYYVVTIPKPGHPHHPTGIPAVTTE